MSLIILQVIMVFLCGVSVWNIYQSRKTRLHMIELSDKLRDDIRDVRKQSINLYSSFVEASDSLLACYPGDEKLLYVKKSCSDMLCKLEINEMIYPFETECKKVGK